MTENRLGPTQGEVSVLRGCPSYRGGHELTVIAGRMELDFVDEHDDLKGHYHG